jgi:DNA-binding cell septation regulator SpoVG
MTSEVMIALRAMLADVQASLVERLARRFDSGNLALLGTVGTALDRVGVDSDATGRNVFVSERPGRALAVVITGAADAFVLHGVRVIKTGPRQRGIAAPAHRVANGRLADTITMPPELASAIATAVLDDYDELRRPPPPVPLENRPPAAS